MPFAAHPGAIAPSGVTAHARTSRAPAVRILSTACLVPGSGPGPLRAHRGRGTRSGQFAGETAGAAAGRRRDSAR